MGIPMNRNFFAFAFAILLVIASPSARADSAAEITRDANATLADLLTQNPGARALAAEAKAILVFPDIVKFGLVVGGQGGEGALIRGGRVVSFYRTASVSYGLQAGVQRFGYALFFMNDNALAYLDRSDGWEIGVGPSLVVADEGIARSVTSTTTRSDIYAFIFDQKGLMAGVGLQGTKITRFTPSR
jgi:lipid-binding SYLF domain-containing protein